MLNYYLILTNDIILVTPNIYLKISDNITLIAGNEYIIDYGNKYETNIKTLYTYDKKLGGYVYLDILALV